MTTKPSLDARGRDVGPSDPTAADTKRSHRSSFIAMASSFRPAKQRFSRYFTKQRHSMPEDSFKAWSTLDLTSATEWASMQMVDSVNPRVPFSPVVRDAGCKPPATEREQRHADQQQHQLQQRQRQRPQSRSQPDRRVTFQPPDPLLNESLHEAPSSPTPAERFPPPSVAERDVSPPPLLPPIAELPQFPDFVSAESYPPRIRRGPSLVKTRQRQGPGRRGAKTPVHHIGQLEMAAAAAAAATQERQEAAIVISRQSSVRTIARQYRALVDVPDILSVPARPSRDEFDSNYGPMPREAMAPTQDAAWFESPGPRPHQIPARRPVSAHAAGPLSPGALRAPPTPPSSDEDDHDAGDKAKASDTHSLRLHVGFELLARELSAASAHSSSRSDGDTSSLQLWVMIEAYERLRDQVSTMNLRDADAKNARAVFDSWLAALRAVQRAVADEGAASESEYEDDA